jgi:hypothetical protein
VVVVVVRNNAFWNEEMHRCLLQGNYRDNPARLYKNGSDPVFITDGNRMSERADRMVLPIPGTPVAYSARETCKSKRRYS